MKILREEWYHDNRTHESRWIATSTNNCQVVKTSRALTSWVREIQAKYSLQTRLEDDSSRRIESKKRLSIANSECRFSYDHIRRDCNNLCARRKSVERDKVRRRVEKVWESTQIRSRRSRFSSRRCKRQLSIVHEAMSACEFFECHSQELWTLLENNYVWHNSSKTMMIWHEKRHSTFRTTLFEVLINC